MNEKNIMQRFNHPSVLKLYASFTDKQNVYMVLDYAINGDMSSFIKLNSKFPIFMRDIGNNSFLIEKLTIA